jgi:predicted MFS family arabinose efflux permease
LTEPAHAVFPPADAELPVTSDLRIVDLRAWSGRLLMPTLICVGLLVAAVSSLGAPLLTTISRKYSVSLTDAQWSLTIALLAGAVALPVIGRLATGRHRRITLLVNVATMVIGCTVSAAAPNYTIFLAGRAMQGCGVAMVPVAMGIARDHLPPEHVRRAVANLGMTTVVGVAAGYPLSGLIADDLGLRAPYALAAVIGTLALTACRLIVPSSRGLLASRVDGPSAMAFGVAVVALIVYLSEGEWWGWRSVQEWALLIGTVLALTLLIRRDLRVRTPLLDLRLMSNRIVLGANLNALLLGAGSFMLMTVFIRLVQTPVSQGYGFGGYALTAGLLLVPMSALGFAGSRVVDRLARLIGPNLILPFGSVLFAASMLAFVAARSHLWEVFAEMGLVGLAVACTFPVLLRLVVRSVPSTQTSSTLALTQVLRPVGTSGGSAVCATVLAAATPAGAAYPTAPGYTSATLLSTGFFVVCAVLGWALVPRSEFAANHAPSARP